MLSTALAARTIPGNVDPGAEKSMPSTYILSFERLEVCFVG